MHGSLSFGLVYDDGMLRHDTGLVQQTLDDGTSFDGVEHPSSSSITKRIHALLVASGFAAHCASIAPLRATEDDLALFHTREHIARVKRISADGGGSAGESAPLSADSYDAALLSSGAALAAVDVVLDGRVRSAYALSRPPGHHALAGEGMGYCIFNNIVLAARHAQRRGARRPMIVDWDVHHGNGTQSAFYGDPSVMFLSFHQDGWYPAGSGSLDQRGVGDGIGFTLNVPLPAGTGDRGYLEAFDRLVAPAARQFSPDILLVSAGQDASMLDPLGRMLLTMDGFYALGQRARALAGELCGGRLVLVQEGGYSLPYTPYCALGTVCGASDSELSVPDPYEGSSEISQARSILSRDTEDAIRAAVQTHAPG
jgi:acetoin utilization deacetylase AcuC-like enzyme